MRHKLLFFLCIAVLLSGCGPSAGQSGNTASSAASSASLETAVTQTGFLPEIREQTLTIPGLKDEYRLLFLSDLHIIAPEDPDVNDDKKEEVEARRTSLFIHDGMTSAELWEKLAPALDGYDADAILLGGDMIDYCSAANVRLLEQGLTKIKTPLLYVRADHDTETWYTDAHMSKEDAASLQNALADAGAANDGIITMSLGDLLLIGINNSTSQITPEQHDTLQELLEQNRPTVILTHVPLKPLEDTALLDLSRAAWQDRALVWGNDCYHVPDAVTAAAYAPLYEDASPVRAVLSGHLHFAYEGPLTEGCLQSVYAPAYEGHIALITVTGQ